MHVDFLPVLDRVQIFAECGARRARCDVAAGAAGAGRRFAVHVLQPLVTGGVADETLLGLPESVRRVIYELLPAPAVGLVAEAAKPLREEASSDAVWMRLLRRDADALLVDPRDLPTADRMRRARDIYAAFVQFGRLAGRLHPDMIHVERETRRRRACMRRPEDDSGGVSCRRGAVGAKMRGSGSTSPGRRLGAAPTRTTTRAARNRPEPAEGRRAGFTVVPQTTLQGAPSTLV